ncbi:MAG TPA: protein kinase [Pseudonocardiaceae bacterium]
MKAGQVLRGYTVTTRPTNDGAGKCLWAVAERDGEQFFVKEFLDPKRPVAGSMGSPESIGLRLAQCAEFERRHQAVMSRIDPDDLDAGNLVVAVDFFAEGTRYYKVTRLLRPADLTDTSRLTPRQRAVLLGTLCDSLGLLHRLDIVHGDLKPQNILLHRPAGSGLYTAKLIDFDDSYVSGDPPSRDEVGGDARYLAPEWLRYVRGERDTGPERLTTAVDVFALGLVVHTYLTGALPAVPTGHTSVAAAVDAGEEPGLDPDLEPELAAALRAVLVGDPARRPAVAELAPVLATEALLALRRAAPPIARDEPPAPPPSRLRVNLTGRRGPG